VSFVPIFCWEYGLTLLKVNYLIADGKSHWLEGVLLMTLYLIIAIAAWFYD
jgi:Ca2+:H+ antiporter